MRGQAAVRVIFDDPQFDFQALRLFGSAACSFDWLEETLSRATSASAA